jgi:predicted ATPase
MPRAARSRTPATFLQSVALRARADESGRFPFNVPAIRSLTTLDLASPVTFFVGENGSGKSTLLEAIAIASQVPAAGSHESWADPTLAAQRALAGALRLSWSRRTRRGLFLRAEDFFGYAKRMDELSGQMARELEAIAEAYADRSAHARTLASGPANASLAAVRNSYGDGLDARSHGQAFLTFLGARLSGPGLYLLDEPETPLSPQNQLALLAHLHAAVEDGAQFIIATHSPIVLAYPKARIYAFDEDPVMEVAYDALDHVRLTRDFLRDPARYLARICGPAMELDLG